MNECRSEKARKDRYSRGKRFQEGCTTRKVYSKVVVWMEQWKVQNRISEKVGKELAKVEVSFSNLEEGVISELQEVDLVLFYFLPISYFPFDLFFLFYSLHLGLGLMMA